MVPVNLVEPISKLVCKIMKLSLHLCGFISHKEYVLLERSPETSYCPQMVSVFREFDSWIGFDKLFHKAQIY